MEPEGQALWNDTGVRATPDLGGVQRDSQILMGEDRRQVGQKRNKNAYILGLAERSVTGVLSSFQC